MFFNESFVSNHTKWSNQYKYQWSELRISQFEFDFPALIYRGNHKSIYTVINVIIVSIKSWSKSVFHSPRPLIQ